MSDKISNLISQLQETIGELASEALQLNKSKDLRERISKTLEITTQVHQNLIVMDYLLQNSSENIDIPKTMDQTPTPTSDFQSELLTKTQEDLLANTTEEKNALKEKTDTPHTTQDYGAIAMENSEWSINDKLKNSTESLSEKFEKKPLESLRESLGLNDLHYFRVELFESNEPSFNQYLAKLDGMNSWEQALGLIKNEIGLIYDWDMESAAVNKFLVFVQRKFGVTHTL